MIDLKFRIIAERSLVRNDDVSELDIAIEVVPSASGPENVKKSKKCICVVIDKSGSMEGDKLEQAKQGALSIFKSLNSDDQIFVVAFTDQAETIVNPTTPKSKIDQKIRSITAGGGTNLSLGWYLALLELQSFSDEDSFKHVILLSDGAANDGETKRTVLAAEAAKARELGISTSTIGIGKDFTEELLEAIATESGGFFHVISEKNITKIIAEEFAVANDVVFGNPQVELMLPPGCVVSQQLNRLKQIGSKYRIPPISAGDNFYFATRVQITPSEAPKEKLVFRARLLNQNEQISESSVEIGWGKTEDVVLIVPDQLVRAAVEKYLATQTHEKVAQLFADADFNLAAKLLVEEFEGMKRVRDSMAEKRQFDREMESAASELSFEIEQGEAKVLLVEGIGLIRSIKGDDVGLYDVIRAKTELLRSGLSKSMHSQSSRYSNRQMRRSMSEYERTEDKALLEELVAVLDVIIAAADDESKVKAENLKARTTVYVASLS